MTDTPIRGRETLAATPARRVALDCVEAGIEAAHPRRVIADAVGLDGDRLRVADATYDLDAYDDVVVLGGGKAAVPVAAALEDALGDRLDRGAVVAPDADDDGSGSSAGETAVVDVLPGDHPVPTERGVASTRTVLDLGDAAAENTLVLAAITGGGSALLAAPADDVSLADLRKTTDALLESGASIHEFNAVRKHLSEIKGGRLARAAAPATVVTLLLSDVVGNDLDVIASGPTVPDPTAYADALDVLDRYDVDPPASVRDRLERGARGEIRETPSDQRSDEPPIAPLSETPTADDPAFDRASTHVLADGFTALAAARDVAADRGYRTLILSSRVRGEAREAALAHAAVAEEAAATGNPVEPPAVVLSGGETTVTVRGDGTGGPNQEFALRAAVELAGGDADATVAAVDTDGLDGSTDAAGGLVDRTTVDDPDAALDALADNDAYPYLDDRDALVYTGPTGTNVNDLRVVVVEE